MTTNHKYEAKKGAVELRRLLAKYEADPEAFAHLTMNLYETYDDCDRFLLIYEGMFDVPGDPEKEREHLAELLAEGKILLEDLLVHASEVIRAVDSFVDVLDLGK